MTVTIPPQNTPEGPPPNLRVVGYLDSSIDSIPTENNLVQVELQLSRPLSRFEQHLVDNADEYDEDLLTIYEGDDTTLVGLRVDDMAAAIQKVNAILNRIQDYGEQQTDKHERVTASAREALQLIQFD